MKMFPQFIYDIKEYNLSGQHREENMIMAKDSGVDSPRHINHYINYCDAIKTAAENAPIYIDPETKIIGSTTYLEGPLNLIPFLEFWTTSHTTFDFKIVIEKGTDFIKNQIIKKINDNYGKRSRENITEEINSLSFWEAELTCIEALEIWHNRYLEALKDDEIKSYFENVPMKPATNFKEAVQSLFFTFVFTRLCGNWPGIGRIDEFLYPYYKKDLDNGLITYEEARLFLANMWVKGTEWAFGYDEEKYIIQRGSGDAQNYQNIVLGGINKDGVEVTNDITYMVLDIVEELGISDFPISMRLNKNTPEKLHKRIAEVVKKGGGIVACYNEDIIIKALTNFGIDEREAREFANDGCWEAIIPGKTAFGYIPFDTLYCVQIPLFSGKNYTDFEEFYNDFETTMEKVIFKIKKDRTCYDPLPNPGVIASLFVEGCTEKGLDYNNYGPKYTFCGIHAGGIANASDSLFALKDIVFDKKLYTFEDYVKIIKSNWVNQGDLRIMALNCPKYGNDSEGDLMAQRVFNSFVTINEKIREMRGVLFPSGISTFGRENEWRDHRKATADGHLQGEILAGNMSPSPGCDISGPTSMLKSYCKLDFSRLPNVGPLDMELDPSSLNGEEGTKALIAINKTLVELGGSFLQVNVVDKETLLDAQKNPDLHKNLSVRVSGWNARFATLDQEWQKMVINRLS